MVDNLTSSVETVDPRVSFAAERTLLAWIRTGLAMMSFGFVVARFGLFMRELAAMPRDIPLNQTGFSLWVGTALVLFGVCVTLGSAAKYWSTIKRLERGETLRTTFWSLEMLVAFSLALLGLVMAGYLIFGIDHSKG